MPGKTLAELHEAFIDARTEFEAALRLAEGHWEDQILEPEDGISDAWPPHMAAAHAVLGERWRFRYIDMVLGTPAAAPAPGHEEFVASEAGQQELAERRQRYEAMDSVASALAAAAQEWASIDERFARLNEADLAHPAGLTAEQLDYLTSFGETPSNDVGGCLRLAAVHLRDHAQQLRTAFEAG